MSVWISKVKLENFKVYQNVEFEFPEPNKKNGNIILIGAENKSGKTSFLEALYLGFYGETRDTIKNMGKTIDNFDIKDFLFSQAEGIKRGNTEYSPYTTSYNMIIQIEFCWKVEDKTNRAKIVRRWKFNNSKQFMIDYKSLFFLWKDDINDWFQLSDENSFKKATGEFLARVEHSSFFLFNAAQLENEKIDDNTINKWIKKGLEDLTGITLLVKEKEGKGKVKKQGIKQEIEEVSQKEIKTLKDSMSQKQELEKLSNDKEDLENSRIKIINNLKKIEQELENLDIEINSIINKLRIDDIDEFRKRLEKEISLEKELKLKEDEIQKNLKDFSLLFLSNRIIDEFRKELNKEAKLLELELARKKLEPKVGYLCKLLWDSSILEELKTILIMKGQDINKIEESFNNLVEDSVKSIWEPEKDELAKYIRHNYISLQHHSEIAMTIQNRKMPNNSIIDLIYQVKDIKAELEELKEQINNRNEKDIDIEEEEIKDLFQRHKDLLAKIKTKTAEQVNLEKELKTIDNELRKIEDNINIIISATSLGDKDKMLRLTKITSAIEEISNKLAEFKSTQIEDNVNSIHQEISNDNNILINVTNYEIHFIGLEGNKLKFKSFSSGQKQVIICSLIFALAKATSSFSPLVIDTPLGLLSKEYHNNFMKYLASLPQQIILTPHDKEIDKEEYMDLKEKGYIQETYLITVAEKLSDGNKKSIVERGKFFEF